jgi:hypothetical protein
MRQKCRRGRQRPAGRQGCRQFGQTNAQQAPTQHSRTPLCRVALAALLRLPPAPPRRPCAPIAGAALAPPHPRCNHERVLRDHEPPDRHALKSARGGRPKGDGASRLMVTALRRGIPAHPNSPVSFFFLPTQLCLTDGRGGLSVLCPATQSARARLHMLAWCGMTMAPYSGTYYGISPGPAAAAAALRTGCSSRQGTRLRTYVGTNVRTRGRSQVGEALLHGVGW